MKYHVPLMAMSITLIFNYAQAQNRQIEIKPYRRFDKYPQFTSTINDIATYNLSIKGNSWGISAAYKIPIRSRYLIKTGIGYYKYSFSKIESTHRTFGKGNRRRINYLAPVDMIIVTDKYWYNTAIINIGVERSVALKKDLQLSGGIDFINYFTFSQYYHLPYSSSSNTAFSIENDYRKSVKRYFGFSAQTHIDLIRKLGKISLGPSLIIPVYDTWKQDNLFPTETNTSNRNKWLNGIGIGIICNYSLSNIMKNRN